MGDRFYTQMLNAIGTAPGYRGTRKRRMSKWNDELREEVVAEYVERDPTPENSMEIVKEIAEAHDLSPNGVRMVLTKAEVYVKKGPSSAKKDGTAGGARVSKAAAQESLTQAIQDAGQEADDEIISRLTGKAAAYLAGVINAISD